MGATGETKISVVEKPETRRKGPNGVGRHGTRTNTRAFLHTHFVWDLFLMAKEIMDIFLSHHLLSPI